MRRSWTAAGVAIGLYLLTGWTLGGETGLVRTIVANTPRQEALDVRRVDAIDLEGLDAAPAGPSEVIAKWHGAWEVQTAGLYNLALASTGRSSWTIDDALANESSGDAGTVTRTVSLDAGFHRVEISYHVDASAPRLVVAAAPLGRPTEPLAVATLKPRLPRNPRLRIATQSIHRVLGWLALVAVGLAIRPTTRALAEGSRQHFDRAPARGSAGDRVRRWGAYAGHGFAWTALACILVHGALLRIDAIAGKYGPVTSPPWLAALQGRSIAAPAAIRPASIGWNVEPMYPHRDGTETRYRSDPYTYLDAGRTMTSFYGAHFREPVFPFATKVWLRVLGGQDVAVSFASAFFSTLAIGFTYLLGAMIWSRPVGLLAALGLSLDYDVISLGSLGWRDDAYMAVVTLCAYLMLRWWRAGEPGARFYRVGRLQIDAVYLEAGVVGVAGGFAILTRIMAVSFLAAGIACMVLARRKAWRRQLAPAGLAAVLAVLVAAPYFVNCWRVYGDPLYTFNVHGGIYSLAEKQGEWEGSTASYVGQKIARRPLEMIDTVAQGLTTYPFSNKWSGLNLWLPRLGQWASLAAIAGLAVLAASSRGRVLLLVMVSSLVPFSFTWMIDPDFRFTVHVYPFLLIAAAAALGAGAHGLRAVFVPARAGAAAGWRTAWPAWAIVVGAALAVLWFVGRVSPVLVFAEALRARGDATVMAGARDGAFFGRGWSSVIRGENVSMRVVTQEGALSIRLPEIADYPATLRMDPFPRPLADAPSRLPVVEIVLNGTPVTGVPLQWTPGRVGAYAIVLPRAAVRRGANRLVLRVKRPASSSAATSRPGLADGDAIALWYVRVHPPAPSRSPSVVRLTPA